MSENESNVVSGGVSDGGGLARPGAARGVGGIKQLYRELYSDEPLIFSDAVGSPASEPKAARAGSPMMAPFDYLELKGIDRNSNALIKHGAQILLDLFADEGAGAPVEPLRVGEWTKKIEQDLRSFATLLEDIRGRLVGLKIHVDDAFNRDVEYEVLAACETYVVNIDAYQANPTSPLLQKLLSDLYIKIQPAVRKLMHYGYAPAFGVFYAFRVELDLARLLALGKQTEKLIARDYFSYLDMCLAPPFPGTIANILGAVDASIRDIEARYTAGDKGFVGPAWWYTDNCRDYYVGHDRELVTRCDKWRIHPGYTITGSVSEGFDGQATFIENFYSDSSRNDNEYLSGRETAIGAATQYVRTHILPAYRAATNSWRSLAERKRAVAETHSYCEQFREKARQIMEQP